MKTYEFQGVVTALSSIAHNGGQSYGINSKLRREKFVQADGSVEEIPVISGNGMRGLLRDRGMLHMCRLLGYGGSDDTGSVQGLTLKAFHFLFSGGSLSDGGSKSIDEDEARRLRSLIPLVGVFGGAMGNRILPGRLKMGKLIPICRETNHLLPARIAKPDAASIWDYTQEEMYTRKDDEKNEHLRGAIDATERLRIEAARSVKAVKNAEDGPPQQMMYFVETLAAGTRFYWRITLDDVTDLEFEAFMAAMVEFSRLPYIGGKSNVGLGEVAVKFDRWMEIDSRTVESKEIDAPLGSKYVAHLAQRGKDIRQYLQVIQ